MAAQSGAGRDSDGEGRVAAPLRPDRVEADLLRAAERLGASNLRYDYGRGQAWIEFSLAGRSYRLEHGGDRPQAGAGPQGGLVRLALMVVVLEWASRAASYRVAGAGRLLAGFALGPAPCSPAVRPPWQRAGALAALFTRRRTERPDPQAEAAAEAERFARDATARP